MNARTLAEVAIRIAALVALAGVLAVCATVAFYASMPVASDPSAALLRAGQVEMVVNLVVRFVVAVVLLVGAGRIARWIAPEAPGGAAIGTARLGRLALALVALFLFVEAIERLAAPAYLLAMRPRAPLGIGSSAQLSQRYDDIVVRSIVMIAAAASIFWRDRIARSLRSAFAAVRRR